MTATRISATKTAARMSGISTLAATLMLSGVPAWAAPGHGAGTGHGNADNIGQPAKPNPATRTINIQLGDSFYKPASVKVRAGETVRPSGPTPANCSPNSTPARTPCTPGTRPQILRS